MLYFMGRKSVEAVPAVISVRLANRGIWVAVGGTTCATDTSQDLIA